MTRVISPPTVGVHAHFLPRGRRCPHVRAQDAAEVIAGYLIVDDVSVRDWQIQTPQWSLAKSFDTHGPIGPWIVTGDEVEILSRRARWSPAT